MGDENGNSFWKHYASSFSMVWQSFEEASFFYTKIIDLSHNWLQVCVEPTALIRQTMFHAGITRLLNIVEMFLQYYPKESHLIAPTNVNRVRSIRGEDDKKGCTVMVA
jgi:hypothetical protein